MTEPSQPTVLALPLTEPVIGNELIAKRHSRRPKPGSARIRVTFDPFETEFIPIGGRFEFRSPHRPNRSHKTDLVCVSNAQPANHTQLPHAVQIMHPTVKCCADLLQHVIPPARQEWRFEISERKDLNR